MKVSRSVSPKLSSSGPAPSSTRTAAGRIEDTEAGGTQHHGHAFKAKRIRDRNSLATRALVAAEATSDTCTAIGQLDAVEGGPSILIAVDPGLSSSATLGRFEIFIRGNVVSTATIEEIRLQVAGRTIASTWFGQAGPGVALTHGVQTNQGFKFTLPCDNGPGPLLFQIVARTKSDFETAAIFVVDPHHDDSDQVTIVSGRTCSLTTPGSALPYVVIYTECATIDPDGRLAVLGWAVALGPVLAVQIFAEGVGAFAVRLAGRRDDVAAAYPDYPNSSVSGFSLTARVDVGEPVATDLRVRVICPHGFAHEESAPLQHVSRQTPVITLSVDNATLDVLGVDALAPPDCSSDADHGTDPLSGAAMPVRAAEAMQPPSEIRLFCDEAVLRGDGWLAVSGWAVCAAGIAQIRVQLDNDDVGLAAFGHERADVGIIYDDIPTASLSGFRFDRHLGEDFEGEHTIRVVVRNARNQEKADTLRVVAIPLAAPIPAAATGEIGSTPTPAQAAEFRFELDAPALVNGVAVEPINGRLTIEGWLLSRTGIASFQVFLDDQLLGDAHYGLARQDVGAAFPDWPNPLRSGFAFHCPPRGLRNGDHIVALKLRANGGEQWIRSFRIKVNKSQEQQDLAGVRRRVPQAETDLVTRLLADLNYRPAYRFILRVGGGADNDQLRATLEALRLQTYPEWSVLLLAGCDDMAVSINDIVADAPAGLAARLTVLSASDTAAWNAPLASTVAGDTALYALLTAGDQPGADMLLEFAVAGGRHPHADFIYADEARISPVTCERELFFKPDFSPDLLLSTNYIGRPWMVTGAVLARTGVTAARLLLDGDYDLVLRCAEIATAIHHIPKVLCLRSAANPDDPAVERSALDRMLVRRNIAAEVLPSQIRGTWRIKRALSSSGLVSIIIPTCATQDHIRTCIESLRARTAYKSYEIVCIDNIPLKDQASKDWLRQRSDKVIEITDAFNWSIFNNRAAAMADGDFLLFLNDDIEVTQFDWLDAMMEHGQRPEVGATGARLLYPDGTVQHGGMFLGGHGTGRHAFRHAAAADPCYFGLALAQRNVIAVTGACLLVRRETFQRFGGFNEAHAVTNNDLDFCLRVHRAGLLTVFTPYATLTHHELASRGAMKDVHDERNFASMWKTRFAAGDPYFNPGLSGYADDYRPDDEPVQWVVPGAPLFHPEDIERILVVKLDHIGDFVTALPPIRRLKELFPRATITVLAGRASRAFCSVEAGIDAFIPFDFFHARSQLGRRPLERTDFIALEKQLRRYRFDIAVDLRKHLSTRDVLKYTGARFLAGFDYLGQFPYLDISLDWDGDRALQRKRSHIIDDLLGLVNAIGHASQPARLVMQPAPTRMPWSKFPPSIQALFVKPVVAVHPGAGNVTKQWPTEHFSALIDLLIERNDVNILLLGGPDEVDVANDLLARTQRPGSIASMTGMAPLEDLPRILLNCVLFIGNDSGPKHIAAAIGMPTIGVHSGVVDPVEWGPLGPRAVALRRNMICSPCYLAKAEDCPRALACLRFLEPCQVYEAAAMMLKPQPVARLDTGRPSLTNAHETALDVPVKAAGRRPRAKRKQPVPLPA